MSTTSEGTGNDHRNQRIQIHKYHHQRFKSLYAYIVNDQVRRTVCWRGVWIWLIKKRGTDKVFFAKNNLRRKTNISAPSRSTQTPMQCFLLRATYNMAVRLSGQLRKMINCKKSIHTSRIGRRVFVCHCIVGFYPCFCIGSWLFWAARVE